MSKSGAGASRQVTWRSRLFTWGLLLLIPVPTAAYMAIAELFLGGAESARLELVLAYIGVVLWFAWGSLQGAWKERRERARAARPPDSAEAI